MSIDNKTDESKKIEKQALIDLRNQIANHTGRVEDLQQQIVVLTENNDELINTQVEMESDLRAFQKRWDYLGKEKSAMLTIPGHGEPSAVLDGLWTSHDQRILWPVLTRAIREQGAKARTENAIRRQAQEERDAKKAEESAGANNEEVPKKRPNS